MTFRETNRPSDAHSNHTEMRTKPRDFTRPASSQGQKPKKLQLASECTPEHPILPGGMPISLQGVQIAVITLFHLI